MQFLSWLRKTPVHRHRYTAAESRWRKSWKDGIDYQTEVLMRCTGCPEEEFVVIDGCWTLDQVRQLRRGKDGRLTL